METLKRKRRYSLYEKRDNKWVRISDMSFLKKDAVRIFQGALLSGALSGVRRELKPVKPEVRLLSL